ncbi:MAG: hypothetical protein WHZ52_14740 [Armatimonadota bacterium]
MLFKKGNADSGTKSAGAGGEKSSIPLPAAIGLLVVALVLLFFLVLRPMLFSEAPPPPSSAPVEGVPGGAPGGSEVPPPPAAPGGTVGGPGAADSAAGQPPAAPGSPAAPAPEPGASAPAPAAPSAPGDVSLTPETGEILVKGTVTMVDAPKLKLRMSVTAVQLGGQAERALGSPRAKEVVLADNTDIVKGGQRVKLADIKPGAAVWAIGPNLGEGQPLVARAVAAQ